MRGAVIAFVSFRSLHPTLAHRGEEDGNKTLAYATLPRATFHFEGQRSTGRHKFQHVTPGSLLDESSGTLMTQEEDSSEMDAKNATPVPGASIIINFGDGLPMARFAGVGNEEKPQGHQATITINHHAPAKDGSHTKVTVGSSSASQMLPPGFKLPKDFEDKFDRMSLSVVRIQAITAEVNWFEPYQQPQDMQLVGSGLAVSLPDVPEIVKDPIFITNAHVVRDAHDVQVQLPAIGQQFFEAFVPLICDDFDLAVVQLVEPAKFMEALEKTKYKVSQLEAFQVEPRQWKLGDEVASVGFPLGSSSLKLSRGVISGTEEVGDFICYQTTAPISPGSSGGPLFGLDDENKLHVVGATFASAAAHGAQNTNYVVPTIAISQVLQEYKDVRQKNLEDAAKAVNPTVDGTSHEDTDGQSEEIQASGAPKKGTSKDHPNESTENPGDSRDGGQTSATREKHLKSNVKHNSGNNGETTNAHKIDSEHPQNAKQKKEIKSVGQKKLGPSKTAHRVHHASHPMQLKTPGLSLIRQEIVIKHPHKQYKIAPVDAVGIEANEALYAWSGCKNGVFLSKILETSVFKKATTKNNAKAEVPAMSFLTQVMGPDGKSWIKLDSFGMGRSDEFLGDPTPFESMMMMKAKPGETVSVKVCAPHKNGAEEEYQVSMRWDDKLYSQKIDMVMEPHFAPEMMRYEVFAGVTVMQMTVNHVVKLLRIGQPPTLGRWLLPENQVAAKLIVTHVEKGTYASRVLAPGMVVDKINDKPVSNFADYEKAFVPDGDQHMEKVWTLTTDRGVLFATKFAQSIFEQIMKAEMGLTFLFCKTVVEAARGIQKMNLMPDGIGHTLKSSSPQAGPVQKDAFLPAGSNSTIPGLWNTSIPAGVDCGDRVTRVAKVQALARSASMFLETHEQVDETEKDEVRRRARVAHAGFHILPASELSVDEDLKQLLGSSSPME